MSDDVKKPVTKEFKKGFLYGGVILGGGVLLAAGLGLWQTFIQPGVDDAVEAEQVVYVNGGSTGSQVASDILLKEQWLDGFTDKFMGDFSEPESKVSARLQYVPCSQEELDCIKSDDEGRQMSFTVTKDRTADVYKEAHDYFRQLGLTTSFPVHTAFSSSEETENFGKGIVYLRK